MSFLKFLGVGGTATLLQYIILILLVEAGSAAPVVASTIGFVISCMYNYLLNYYFTFGSKAKHHIAAVKFATVAIIALAINSTMLYLLTEKFSFYYLFAQLASTTAVLLWNFFAHKHWTYKSTQGT